MASNGPGAVDVPGCTEGDRYVFAWPDLEKNLNGVVYALKWLENGLPAGRERAKNLRMRFQAEVVVFVGFAFRKVMVDERELASESVRGVEGGGLCADEAGVSR